MSEAQRRTGRQKYEYEVQIDFLGGRCGYAWQEHEAGGKSEEERTCSHLEF